MSSITTVFKFLFGISTRESGEVVCYKQDGARFDQVQTVKFNADTEYEMKFTFQPALKLHKLLINGDLYKVNLTGGDVQGEEKLTYRTFFKTEPDVTKRGKRKDLAFTLELQNGVYMKFAVQCKVYKAGETDHAQWGQKLGAIYMECEMELGQNYVTVINEKYI